MNPLELFPYEPREGQKALISFIQAEVLEGRRVCIHASTGFGKTPAILAALLPFVRHSGAILWAVRTGTETDRPIEELKSINERLGTKFSGLSYRGKRDMCLLARDIGPEDMDYEEVSFLCERKVEKGECEYHSNTDSFRPSDFLRPMLYSEILHECEREEICPYLVQRELLPFVHVASMSYNYIVSKSLGWTIKRMLPFNRSFLVIDEAHNLQQACSSINSTAITSGTVERAFKEIERFRGERAKEIMDFLLFFQSRLRKIASELKGEETKLDVEKFLRELAGEKKVEALEEKFESVQRYGDWIRRLQLEEGKRPLSSLHALGRFLSTVFESAGIEGVVLMVSRKGEALELECWDMRASELLKEKWKEFRGCVFCSGALEPIRAFAETVGLEDYGGKNFRSPFDIRRVKTLVLKGLSTRGEELAREMARRYVKVLEQFIEAADVNLAIFCSSYRIQTDLFKAGLAEVVKLRGRPLFREASGMSGDESRRVLDEFKRCARRERKGVLCASASGRFAEGADFPGEELEAIFLVGIPFERMTVRTQVYIDYYKRLYGGLKGRFYAYIVPTFRRASQALGRVLRSNRDRALLVCGDERYADKRFFHLLPDYARRSSEVIEVERLPSKIEAWIEETSNL